MSPQRIIVIGASTVQGRVDPEYGGFAGRLRRWHESQDLWNMVFNLGISGATTADLLQRFLPEAQVRKPDLIFISVGLNDSRREGSRTAPNRIPLPQFKDNVRELLRQGRSLADVAFVDINPVDEENTAPVSWADNYFLMEDAKNYAEAAKEVCAEEDVPCLGIFNKLLGMDYKALLYEDGLHLNADGHQFVFEEMKRFLEARG